jgi:heat shock protein 5
MRRSTNIVIQRSSTFATVALGVAVLLTGCCSAVSGAPLRADFAAPLQPMGFSWQDAHGLHCQGQAFGGRVHCITPFSGVLENASKPALLARDVATLAGGTTLRIIQENGCDLAANISMDASGRGCVAGGGLVLHEIAPLQREVQIWRQRREELQSAVASVVIPTHRFRLGSTVTGFLMIRLPLSPFHEASLIPDWAKLGNFSLELLVPDGQPMREQQLSDLGDGMEATTSATALLRFELHVGKYWEEGSYTLSLKHRSQPIWATQIELGHHSKEHIRVTLSDGALPAWPSTAAPSGTGNLSILADYLHGRPVGEGRARVEVKGVGVTSDFAVNNGRGYVLITFGEKGYSEEVIVHVVDAHGRFGKATAQRIHLLEPPAHVCTDAERHIADNTTCAVGEAVCASGEAAVPEATAPPPPHNPLNDSATEPLSPVGAAHRAETHNPELGSTILKVSLPSYVNGPAIVMGELHAFLPHGAPLSRALVDAYAGNATFTTAVTLPVGGGQAVVVPFELDLGRAFLGQRVRIDVYPEDAVRSQLAERQLDSLPITYASPGFDIEKDLIADAAESLDKLSGLASAELFIAGRQHCSDASALELLLNDSSGDVTTGSGLSVRLRANTSCFGDGTDEGDIWAGLMFVDEGLGEREQLWADTLWTRPRQDPPQPTTRLSTSALLEHVVAGAGPIPANWAADVSVLVWEGQVEAGPLKILVNGAMCDVVTSRRAMVRRVCGPGMVRTPCGGERFARMVLCKSNLTFGDTVHINVSTASGELLACDSGPDCRFSWSTTTENFAWHSDSSQRRAGRGIDGPVVGISLGGSTAVVSIYKHGRVEIIPNSWENRVTPTCVTLSKDGLLVGEDALTLPAVSQNPGRTFCEFKRLAGLDWSGAQAMKLNETLPYKLVNVNGRPSVSVELHDKEVQLAPQLLSTAVLGRMKEAAENYLGREVRHAVITVPAWFSDEARWATKDAGAQAGLEVLRIINEPTAAAIAYGLDKKTEKNILVFRLGGSSYDVTLLTIDNGVFDVVAKIGNNTLGGKLFNERVKQHVLSKFYRLHGKNVSINPRAMIRLDHEVEKAKRKLSSLWHARIDVEDALSGDIDFQLELTRAMFEELNQDLFSSTLGPLNEIFVASGLKKEEVDEIVLTGGATRTPKIQRLIKDYFGGKEVNRGINPDEANSYGAAVQAGFLSGEGGQDLLLLDVTPLTLCLGLANGSCRPMIPRNSVIPTERSVQISASTLPSSGAGRYLSVGEGETPFIANAHHLANLDLPWLTGAGTVEVVYEIDSNGILNVGVHDARTGKSEKWTISNDKGRLTEEEIEQMIKDAEKFAWHNAAPLAEAPGTPILDRTDVTRSHFPETIVLPPQRLIDGETYFNLSVPDAITTWRVRALATAGPVVHTAETPLLVRNPAFTATVAPGHLTLGDDVRISTIVENLQPHWLRGVTLTSSSNSQLKVTRASGSPDPFDVPPLGSANVIWRVRAVMVGDAEFNTTLRTACGFSEVSTLQQPLYVKAPGLPDVGTARMRLESGQAFEVPFELGGQEAFALAVVNLLPSLDVASLEGVESLATYPYGCLEQTVSTTFPNLAALRYLRTREGGLAPAAEQKLLSNLKAGRDRIVREFLTSDGGFSLWPGDRRGASVFHTALGLGMLGLLKDEAPTPNAVLQGAEAYLRNQQGNDGAYNGIRGVHSEIFPNSALGPIPLTAYVAHAQALAGIRDVAALAYLTHLNNDSLAQDSNSLGLLVGALATLDDEEDAEIRARLAVLLLQSAVTQNDGALFWPQGSALTSSVESTSYAVVGLSRVLRSEVPHNGVSSYDINAALDAAVNFILSMRSTCGWMSTIDTMWAMWALADVAETLAGKAFGDFIVTVNGEEVKRVAITPTNRHLVATEVRNVAVDRLQRQGINNISVWGPAGSHVVVEMRRWWPTNNGSMAAVAPWVTISQSIVTQRDADDRRVEVNTVISQLDTAPAGAHDSVMLEQPMPPLGKLSLGEEEALLDRTGASRIEVGTRSGDVPVVALFFDTLPTKLRLNMTFDVPSDLGDVQLEGLRVLPMYKPEHRVAGPTTWLSL